MGPNLKITISEGLTDENYQLVKFDGDIDKAGHAEVREQLDKCITDFSLKSLVFDFTALKFINSEGIGYLMEVHTHLVQRERQLVIVGLNDHVKDVFEAIGIANIVPIYVNLSEFLSKQ